MIDWAWTKPKPLPYVRSPRPYARVAPHIRGRVFRVGRHGRTGRMTWGMEVVNTKTGQVLASDDCTLYERIVDCCDDATAAARATWFWDFSRKGVK